jgi:hypothetical protein
MDRVKECEYGIWSMYFVYVYENRTTEGRRGARENAGGMNLIKIYCKHICKCHNETPLHK